MNKTKTQTKKRKKENEKNNTNKATHHNKTRHLTIVFDISTFNLYVNNLNNDFALIIILVKFY